MNNDDMKYASVDAFECANPALAGAMRRAVREELEAAHANGSRLADVHPPSRRNHYRIGSRCIRGGQGQDGIGVAMANAKASSTVTFSISDADGLTVSFESVTEARGFGSGSVEQNNNYDPMLTAKSVAEAYCIAHQAQHRRPDGKTFLSAVLDEIPRCEKDDPDGS